VDVSGMSGGDHCAQGRGVDVVPDAAGSLRASEQMRQGGVEGSYWPADRRVDVARTGPQAVGEVMSGRTARDQLAQEVEERPCRVVRRSVGPGALDELGDRRGQHRVDQCGPRREVAVDRPGPHARASGDLVQGDVRAVRGERRARSVQDASPVADGVRTRPAS
jgi:hypothetical protein